MYTDFFGLNEKPFSITPDPRYLYLTRRHADALAHLIYGISESGGFIQLTGEVGTGKTTLIRSLLEQLPKKAKIAVILNPNLSAHEFLQAICVELHILLPPKQSKSELISALNNYLLRAHSEGTRVVLIVDEAQTLDAEVLEQVRLLTNLETSKHKLLQIILIGQPELRDVLQRRDMRQIAQRITGRYHLEPLSREETIAYVKHRMKVAGTHAEVFKPSAIRELFRRSSGIPRLINVVADRALLAAYSLDRTKIDGPLVRRAAAEVFGRSKRRWWPYAAIGVLLAGVIAAATRMGNGHGEPEVLPLDPPLASAAPSEPLASVSRRIVSVDALLDSENFDRGPEPAFEELLGLWGIDYSLTSEPACVQAEISGLRCLPLSGGSLFQLRRLDRPSVLTLFDQHGREHWAVVSGIDGETLEVKTRGSTFLVTAEDLLAHWDGTHVLLWRPPTQETESLTPGMRGDAVVWLRDALEHVLGDASGPSVATEEYDAALEQRVREYQRERRLEVDGIAGAQTQLMLASELDLNDSPKLSRRY